MAEEKMKKCPFCGEEILEVAIKCKHCGSSINEYDNQKSQKNEIQKIQEKKPDMKLSNIILGVLAVILILFTLVNFLDSGSASSSKSNNIEASNKEAALGNKIIKTCADGETTIERSKCVEENTGKYFVFVGEVSDIIKEKEIKVMLDTGNYCDVSFTENVASKLKKGDSIKFEGLISYVGSGIMFRHKIKDASLKQ